MPDDAQGIVSIRGSLSVDAAVAKLKAVLEANGVKIFAIVDHSGEAHAAGMAMRNTKLVIFGNPKAGTPLMLAAPTIALDLPLKILIWEDSSGQTWVTYNSVEWLAHRHTLPAELEANIRAIEKLAAAAAGQ